MASTQELAIIYSALILQDEGIAISADKLQKLVAAAGVQIEPFWPGLYAKALEGVDVNELISNISSGAGSAPAAPAAGGAAPPPEKKDEEEEEGRVLQLSSMCGVFLMCSALFTYVNQTRASFMLIVVTQLVCQAYHGSAVVIYIAFNKSLRTKLLALFGKQTTFISSVSVSSRTKTFKTV
uniref:Large ribosomal subunit protein P1 n=1 Tax=Bursaphelenchus xylophilus TaxID=6326 RepID=A0A1I7SGD2_BURXY